jgi:amidase
MDAGVLETCETSLKGFENLGATVERLAPPFSAEKIWEAWVKLRAWANAAGKAALFNNENTRKLLKDDAIWEIETGMALSAVEVHEMSAIRTAWFAKLNEMFATYDALMLPSAQVWPFPVEWDSPKKIADRVMDTYHRWMEVVIPVSLVGVPSLNIPAGFNEAGLPMGIQVFGPRHSDAKLLKIGQRWHEISENASRRPDLSVLVRR